MSSLRYFALAQLYDSAVNTNLAASFIFHDNIVYISSCVEYTYILYNLLQHLESKIWNLGIKAQKICNLGTENISGIWDLEGFFLTE